MSFVYVVLRRLCLLLLLVFLGHGWCGRCPLMVSEVLREDLRFLLHLLRRTVFGKAEIVRGEAFLGVLNVIVEKLAWAILR